LLSSDLAHNRHDLETHLGLGVASRVLAAVADALKVR
jgi:hypothetical protein